MRGLLYAGFILYLLKKEFLISNFYNVILNYRFFFYNAYILHNYLNYALQVQVRVGTWLNSLVGRRHPLLTLPNSFAA
jgi:hypothetical protein